MIKRTKPSEPNPIPKYLSHGIVLLKKKPITLSAMPKTNRTAKIIIKTFNLSKNFGLL